MSQINTNAIVDASGGTTATVNGYTPTASNMAGRNRIINGDMRIDQRNEGASVSAVDSGFPIDRWKFAANPSAKFNGQRNAGAITPPVGFTNYLGATSTSSYSVASGDYQGFQHRIEGFNVADLAWGTANAAPITISFWVRSSLTGTFGGSLYNNAANRSYPFTFTISAANTWEQKTFTVQGDTSGTWTTDNSAGLTITFGLGVGTTYSGTAGAWAGTLYFSATGATSVVGTSGATFYITGVQLEAGSVATPFEHRQYGQELALCQRYYYVHNHIGSSGTRTMPLSVLYATTGWEGTWAGVRTPVPMRSSPTVFTSLAYIIHTGDIYSTLSYSSFGARHLGGGIYSCGGYGGIGTAGTKGMMMCEAQNATTSFQAEL